MRVVSWGLFQFHINIGYLFVTKSNLILTLAASDWPADVPLLIKLVQLLCQKVVRVLILLRRYKLVYGTDCIRRTLLIQGKIVSNNII